MNAAPSRCSVCDYGKLAWCQWYGYGPAAERRHLACLRCGHVLVRETRPLPLPVQIRLAPPTRWSRFLTRIGF